MTNPTIDQQDNPPEKEEAKSTPNLLGLAATVASGIALLLTLFGAGVSYAAETMFGLPHASIYETALDLTDLSAYAIAQLMNHGVSMLFDRSVYANMCVRGWPLMLLGTSAGLLLAGLAWCWGRRAPKPSNKKAKKPPEKVETPAVELRKFGLAVAAFFSMMPIFGAVMIAAMCSLCVLVALAPMIGMVAGESYIKEWVIDPEICFPAMTRDRRMQLDSRRPGSDKGPKSASCIAILKDGIEVARGRLIFMTTKSASLFDPMTGAARRVPIGTNVVEVLPCLSSNASQAVQQSSVTEGVTPVSRPASDASATVCADRAPSPPQPRQ